MSLTTGHAPASDLGASVPHAGRAARASVPLARSAAVRPKRPASVAAAASVDAAGAVGVKLIYAAALIGLAVWPAAAIGFAFAWWSRRRNPPAWLASHLTYLMRTFVIAAGASVIASALAALGAGLLLKPVIAVWIVARAVHGLTRAARGEAIEHPEGFFV